MANIKNESNKKFLLRNGPCNVKWKARVLIDTIDPKTYELFLLFTKPSLTLATLTTVYRDMFSMHYACDGLSGPAVKQQGLVLSEN